MTYLKPTNKQSFFSKNSSKTLAFILIILIILTVLNFSGARSAAPQAVSPFFQTGGFFYGFLKIMPGFFSDKAILAAENHRLLEEMESLRLQLSDYEAVQNENRQLKTELNLKPAGNEKPVTAYVLARSPQIPLDTLFINRGTEDGVQKGDSVLAGQRVLLGEIVESFKSRSTVALDSFAGAVSYGYVERTDEPIEIKGDGGGSIKATVPIDFDIIAGDKIMGRGSAPMLAALVGMIEENSSSGFKEVFMSLPVDASKINLVFIEPQTGE